VDRKPQTEAPKTEEELSKNREHKMTFSAQKTDLFDIYFA